PDRAASHPHQMGLRRGPRPDPPRRRPRRLRRLHPHPRRRAPLRRNKGMTTDRVKTDRRTGGQTGGTTESSVPGTSWMPQSSPVRPHATRLTPRASLGQILLYAVTAFILFYLIFPIFVVIPVSFSSAKFLQFPPPGFSLQWYDKYFSRRDWTDA